ncbi:MAG: hypothetical protein QOK43_2187 [Acidimicrobiaceae bacterium]|nr:hypothetical protein [Acidimicrobiaceae bacterium]
MHTRDSDDPPPATLRWVESVLGGRVGGVRMLTGGWSSAVHALRLESGDAVRRVVLRRYVTVATAVGRRAVEHEANALALIRGVGVPTPELLAFDASASHADVPALVMSRVKGVHRVCPRTPTGSLDELAAALVRFQETAPTGADLPPFQPYPPRSWEPPGWLTDRGAWAEAVAVFDAPPPSPDAALLHRDFHTANVLWTGAHVSGIVDWQAACVGPLSVDASWCSLQLLARCGPEEATFFRGSWVRQSGRRFDRWVDIVLLIDLLSGFPPPIRHAAALEATLKQCLRRA